MLFPVKPLNLGRSLPLKYFNLVENQHARVRPLLTQQEIQKTHCSES